MNCASVSKTVGRVGSVKSGINDRECVGEKTPLDEAADSGKRYGDCVRSLSVLLARQEGSVWMNRGVADRREPSGAQRRTDWEESGGFARPQVVARATKGRPGDGALARCAQEERLWG